MIPRPNILCVSNYSLANYFTITDYTRIIRIYYSTDKLDWNVYLLFLCYRTKALSQYINEVSYPNVVWIFSLLT